MKTNKPKRAVLEREILELKAQISSTYHFANASLNKASAESMMGSGVMLQLTGLGGKELIMPVVIRDGLSDETITALRKDLKRSYDLSTMFKL